MNIYPKDWFVIILSVFCLTVWQWVAIYEGLPKWQPTLMMIGIILPVGYFLGRMTTLEHSDAGGKT